MQVWGQLHPSRSTAFAAAAALAADRPRSRLLIGASLAGDPEIPTDLVTTVDTAGAAQTKVALPLLRELVAQRRLTHDGGADLTGQVTHLLVQETSGGLSVSTRSARTDLVRAAAWAVALAVGAVEEPIPFFVY